MSVSRDLVLPAAGVVLLLGALLSAWRSRLRRRRAVRRALEDALRSPDPIVRRSAVYVATRQGLAPICQILTAALLSERDPRVLDAIADAIGRNAWEPAETSGMIELRLWA